MKRKDFPVRSLPEIADSHVMASELVKSICNETYATEDEALDFVKDRAKKMDAATIYYFAKKSFVNRLNIWKKVDADV